VLSEGDRLDRKYLATIEAGISASQTDEMKSNSLQLVVSDSMHESFSADQQRWLYQLSDFIEEGKGAVQGDLIMPRS
tara:strand:+ start:143 stop:373 length:231 start_codon:yes stop_codon:yes gene_type:complete